MIRSRRFKLEALGLAIFMAGFVAVFLQLFVYAGGDLTPGRPYQVQVVVPNALALAKHADVRHAGVRIGEVARVAIRGRTAVLLLELEDGHAPAYRNARVLVRTKGQAGHADYVDLDPGRPAAGRVPSGGTLSIEHSAEATQFDQILSTLDRPTRRRLQGLLDDLGDGVGRHGGDLNRFLEGSAALTRESRPVNEVLAADRRQLAGLVDDFGRVTRALGDRRDAIRLLTVRSKTLAEAVAARDERLRETLNELPGFLRQTRATTTRLGGFADSATPVIRDMRIATDELTPAMRTLRPASAAARRTMHALGDFTRTANPMVEHLAPFADASARLAPPLEAFLRQFNPLQEYLARYDREFGAVFANLKAATESTDAIGHHARLVSLVNLSRFPGTFTHEQEAAYGALLDAGALTEVDPRGVNPYPKPGGADRERLEPFGGDYPRLQAEPPYSRPRR